jgi:SAM-dependent methyltransferase
MDIGCGTGETLNLLKGLGWDPYGMDIDKQAIVIAHKRGLNRVRFGSYTSLNTYPDGFFDVIRLYHVIEHLDNPDLFCQLAFQKLKKGGELIIGTPNADSFVSRLFGSYWYNLDSPRHLIIFSPSTLRRLLGAHKFIVRYVDFCSIGGIVGSVQYILREKFSIRRKIINDTWAIIFMYPLERILDLFGAGDVFIVHAVK